MKKGALKIANVSLFILLVSIVVFLIVNYGLTNDAWFLIVLASLGFVIYFLGSIFPNFTVGLICKFSQMIYKNSSYIQVPVIDEAKRTFKKRLPYILMIVNILMLLLMLTILFQ